MPRPEEKYPVSNYLPDVRFVTCFFTWQSYSNGSKPNLFESHQHVDRSLCPCSLWTKLATGYRFSPAFKRAVTNKQSLIAAGSAALAVDLSRQWIIGKLRNEKTLNHWFTNYYCLAHAALHNNHDRDRNDANTEEYCGRLKNTVSAACHSSDVAIKNSAPNTMLWNKV
ncbi:unnamed protein product [Fusarium graminearum]|uniref:Uncharacterized protein n=1 Tax=Gibberella zeae TaxID=5518 RepID=A0A9N8NIB8_GIBZA|nr:unnamed protein product [Fusarium graminearum]CAG1977775.1 unnamed protein product [Fusarium graminearum]